MNHNFKNISNLNYKFNVIKVTNSLINKKNFFIESNNYFIMFFDFAGIDKAFYLRIKDSFQSTDILRSTFTFKKFLMRSIVIFDSSSSSLSETRTSLIVNKFLNANELGFLGLLSVNRYLFSKKLIFILSFFEMCFLKKFVNPSGKKYLLGIRYDLNFFLKPLALKLNNMLICPKFFFFFLSSLKKNLRIQYFEEMSSISLIILIKVFLNFFFVFFQLYYLIFLKLSRIIFLYKNGDIKSVSL
jgi:hypothetical protein